MLPEGWSRGWILVCKHEPRAWVLTEGEAEAQGAAGSCRPPALGGAVSRALAAFDLGQSGQWARGLGSRLSSGGPAEDGVVICAVGPTA